MELTPQDVQWAKDTMMKTGLFTCASPESMKKLVEGLEKNHYKRNSTILFQGEISCKLYLIETGKVSINVKKGSERLKVAELETGSFFGEISLLMPRAATATVKAEDDTDIISLPGEAVQALVKTDLVFADFINAKIQERLKAHESK